MQGIIRNKDLIRKLYLICALTECFNVEEPRPLTVLHEYIQPVEVHILEYIHNTKNNHKLYNLIQNTPHKFSLISEEHKIIRALELLWPLFQTKNVIRLLAKLLTSSDIIRPVFSNGCFADDDPL